MMRQTHWTRARQAFRRAFLGIFICLAAAAGTAQTAGPDATSGAEPEADGWLQEFSSLRDQQRYREALAILRPRANAGDARAQGLLGDLYTRGEGVPEDWAQAARWSHKAAEAGDSLAMHNLGRAYELGQGLRQDLAEAVRYYRSSAEAGHPTAQARLGDLYVNGTGVEQDFALAARWLSKAAPAGDPGAQNQLGFLYATGQGVVKDLTAAERWWRIAATAGNPAAQFNLARMYLTGLGVQEDAATAEHWLRMAAGQGHQDAAQQLAQLRQGTGAPQAAAPSPPGMSGADGARPRGVFFAGTEKGKRKGWWQVADELRNMATLSGALVQELPPGVPFAPNQAPAPGHVIRSLRGAGWLLYVRVTSLSGFPQWGVDRVQVECYDPGGVLLWQETATNRMGSAKRPIQKITKMISNKVTARRGGPCLRPEA